MKDWLEAEIGRKRPRFFWQGGLGPTFFMEVSIFYHVGVTFCFFARIRARILAGEDLDR